MVVPVAPSGVRLVKLLDHQAAVEVVQRTASRKGWSPYAFCENLGAAKGHFSHAEMGRRSLPPSVQEHFGLRKITAYEVVDPAKWARANGV